MRELSDSLYGKLTELLQSSSGVTFKSYKKYLMEHRLRRFFTLDRRFESYEAFYRALLTDSALRKAFITALTTNYTYFFREEVHFRFLSYYLKEKARDQSCLRFWSAACATGEEAYSMAITCAEAGFTPGRTDTRILATDISEEVLKVAREGVYPSQRTRGSVPEAFLKKYFLFDRESNSFSVREPIRELLQFSYLNLMDPYPFRKKFDIVFLRNVLIYFDRKYKEHILGNIMEVIKPRGYLILGLSESLVGVAHGFTPLKHSIYRKDR